MSVRLLTTQKFQVYLTFKSTPHQLLKFAYRTQHRNLVIIKSSHAHAIAFESNHQTK